MEHNSHSLTRKYRSDYKPVNFQVHKIYLDFHLDEDKTLVIQTSSFERIGQQNSHLVLNGEDLELKTLELNGKPWSKYTLENNLLTLQDVPDQFELRIVTLIEPQNNTQLSGLYKSHATYCTQCEAEGFRRITFFFDRPDVMTEFTTRIEANAEKYPYLLSNGNCIEKGNLPNGKHFAVWQDPFKKPCYLFALVAGDFDLRQDTFTTCSGREILLEIYVDKGFYSQTAYAMESIKKAMRWDEEAFGREYDLDRFMIVAISDFNMGAMENKGLNIFNTKYILADEETATDTDYDGILSVIGHEYFHNWTGNRVTCRDWFQLSLKEGLTIFRDQEFSSDMLSRPVNRIQNVHYLRTYQFAEDAGPMSHPVRPESYLQIDNFYTLTIYEKGSEVIRMIETLVGKEGFRKGMDLYFHRHDGQAVTIDDFVNAMETANQINLSQFKLWYSQAGTPSVSITREYDSVKSLWTLTLEQTCPPTPGQEQKQDFYIPIKIAFLDKNGIALDSEYQGATQHEHLIILTQKTQQYEFSKLNEDAIPSLNRNFSAPIHVNYNYQDQELFTLLKFDTDPFAKWEARQMCLSREFLRLQSNIQNDLSLELHPQYLESFKENILQAKKHPDFSFELLNIPSEKSLINLTQMVDIDALYKARKSILKQTAIFCEKELVSAYHENKASDKYSFDVESVGKRSLRNLCLNYLIFLDKIEYTELAKKHYDNANNMTDRFAALTALVNTTSTEKEEALKHFYTQFKNNALVIDKWFTAQALADNPETLEKVISLTNHPDFSIENPNRFRSLIMQFAMHNLGHYHHISGKGYQLLADFVLKLNTRNPQIAARSVEPLIHWRRFDKTRSEFMRNQLERIINEPEISSDLYEVVEKGLLG